MSHSKKILFSCLLVLFGPFLHASTFVGNGGNMGDIELQVAIQQIRDAILNLPDAAQPCQCELDEDDHPVCETLKSLTEDQQKYCGDVLQKQRTELLELLAKADRIQFRWSDEDLKVMEMGRPLSVDALANYEQQEILIQRNRFLSSSAHERIFLLSHELLHLAPWEGKPIKDEQNSGPFQEVQGGRHLLNAVAAQVVVQSYRKDLFDKYEGALNRSQNTKSHWLEAFAGISHQSEKTTSLTIEDFQNLRLAYRYHWDRLGVGLRFDTSRGTKTLFTRTKAEEQRQKWGVGLNYRIVLGSNPLTVWGQSHLILAAYLEMLQSRYKLDDGEVELQDGATAPGATVGCTYYTPARGGLWFSLGVEYSSFDYSYKGFSTLRSFDEKSRLGSVNLGVSYGF